MQKGYFRKMNNKLKWAKELLESTNSTLAVINGEKYHTSSKKGVLPVYEALTSNPEVMKNGYAADKVTGAASAWLMIYGGVKALYTEIISLPALEVLKNGGIEVEYGIVVGNIENRTKDGICPMEKATLGCKTPGEAFAAVEQKLIEFGSVVRK